MEKKKVRKEVEQLLRDYVGLRLRENAFDPQGKGYTSSLDNLAHYDLAINAALLWTDKTGDKELDENTGETRNCMKSKYPNQMEREAMILSTFAGIILDNLSVEDVFTLYRNKPTTFLLKVKKNMIVHPFSLSSHPFAMLTAPNALEHARKHGMKLHSLKSVTKSKNKELNKDPNQSTTEENNSVEEAN
ncbi:uncharacterized protein C2orf80-like [Erpetoichthys calabaricus]|uniref:uncharacterized protein C2orf80-like n=1 Tax=Erpetoichthys calabaricus TaxID=27687 RepID=UPI0022346E7A|nr:uncharacterized protein C2orf80-like [Erpetoichthys calabaricus]XP_051787361.1 uncharacterized protein C2orf80-like [Erpetoichthys calabaricus]